MVHLGDKAEAIRLTKGYVKKLSLMENPTKADALVLAKQGAKKLGRRVKMRGNRVVGRGMKCGGSNPIDDFIKGFRFDGKGINTIGDEADVYGKGVPLFDFIFDKAGNQISEKSREDYKRFTGGKGFLLDEAIHGAWNLGKKAKELHNKNEAERAVKEEAFNKRMAEIEANNPFKNQYGQGMTTGKRADESIGDMFQRMRDEDKAKEAVKTADYNRRDKIAKDALAKYLAGGEGFFDDLGNAWNKASNDFGNTFGRREHPWDKPSFEKKGGNLMNDISEGLIDGTNWIDRNIFGNGVESALRYGRGKGGSMRTRRMPNGSVMSEHRKHLLEGRGFLDNLPKYNKDDEPPFSWIEKERCDAMGECEGRYKRGRAFADILGEGM